MMSSYRASDEGSAGPAAGAGAGDKLSSQFLVPLIAPSSDPYLSIVSINLVIMSLLQLGDLAAEEATRLSRHVW